MDCLATCYCNLYEAISHIRRIRNIRRAYDRSVRVPPALAGQFAGAQARGFGAWVQAREAEDFSLFGDHEGALNPLEALATESANHLREPDSRASKVGVVDKDARVRLIRKLGDYYEVEAQDGLIGWLGTNQVVPGYLFDQELSAQYAPQFNPDQYLNHAN